MVFCDLSEILQSPSTDCLLWLLLCQQDICEEMTGKTFSWSGRAIWCFSQPSTLTACTPTGCEAVKFLPHLNGAVFAWVDCHLLFIPGWAGPKNCRTGAFARIYKVEVGHEHQQLSMGSFHVHTRKLQEARWKKDCPKTKPLQREGRKQLLVWLLHWKLATVLLPVRKAGEVIIQSRTALWCLW